YAPCDIFRFLKHSVDACPLRPLPVVSAAQPRLLSTRAKFPDAHGVRCPALEYGTARRTPLAGVSRTGHAARPFWQSRLAGIHRHGARDVSRAVAPIHRSVV